MQEVQRLPMFGSRFHFWRRLLSSTIAMTVRLRTLKFVFTVGRLARRPSAGLAVEGGSAVLVAVTVTAAGDGTTAGAE